MTTSCTRFAPSPTGYLHLGHGASALLAMAWARQNNAKFILRIEDIDRQRCRKNFESAIFEDLDWLGLRWVQPVRRQSDHLDEYGKALSRLIANGLLYRCFLTRREVMAEIDRAPHGMGQVYHRPDTPPDPNHQQDLLEQGKSFAWRLSLARAREYLGAQWDDLHWHETGTGPNQQSGLIRAEPNLLGDVILARKDIASSYHLAVTHDDGAQNISQIIRGQDLFDSTHIHVLLQALMGLPTPDYMHHGLLRDQSGKRLAKRDGANSLRALRNLGVSADQVRAMAQL